MWRFSQAISKVLRALWSPEVFEIFFIPLRKGWKIDLLQTSNTAYFHNCKLQERKAGLGVTRPNREQFSEGPRLIPGNFTGRGCAQNHEENKHQLHFWEKSKQILENQNMESNLSNSD